MSWQSDLRKFQRERGLVADATMGPKTWGAIEGAVYFPLKPTSLKSFSESQAKKFYGDPAPEGLRLINGRFVPDRTWRKENIVYVQRDNLPLAAAEIDNLHARLPFHRLIVGPFRSLMYAWDNAGLLPLIKTWNGSTVFRATRRPGSVKLSRHAFGGAFDLNAKWNPMGKRSADINVEGSVMRLVDIATEYNFYWGGWFNDAMHFEYARRV